MSNNKERYFVFAHTGAAFISEHCYEMKIEKAFGTTLSDGMHVTHIQMCKNNGKRASAANKVLDQYNSLVGDESKQLVAAQFPGCEHIGVVCLKREGLLSHPMILKIASDIELDVAAAWAWPMGTELLGGGKKEKIEPETKKAKAVGGSVAPKQIDGMHNAVVAALYRMGCGPNSIERSRIISASEEISGLFQKQFDDTVVHGKEHMEFIRGHVKRIFDKDLDFVCVRGPDSHVTAAVMSDIVGEGRSDPLVFPPGKVFSVGDVNFVTANFFRGYLGGRLGVDPKFSDLTAKEFISSLNKGSFGAYKLTSVESFLAPLIGAKVLVPCDTKRPYRLFRVDHDKVAAFLLQ